MHKRITGQRRLAICGALLIGTLIGCGAEDSLHPADFQLPEVEQRPAQEVSVDDLAGQKGKLRFNLTFTREQSVDLDLYVQEPSGNVINYEQLKSSSGGELDVDCRCDSCDRGPSENITWPDADPATGAYRVWIAYFGSCDEQNSASEYTLRILRDDEVVKTITGSLQHGKTEVYVHQEARQ